MKEILEAIEKVIDAPTENKKERKARHRCICFTLNNYTSEEEKALSVLISPLVYLIYGKEKGKKGTAHLQGYAEADTQMELSRWKKIPGLKRAHIEARKGTQEQAIKYCMKDGNFIELGTKKQQGKRNDLPMYKKLAVEKGMREVVKEANLQQILCCEKYLKYAEPPRTWKTNVSWYWGETGTGKTKTALEDFQGGDVYIKGDSTKWFDGYDGHENVILDDFRGNWMQLSDLLTLIDRYERRVETKGGSRQFRPKNVIITSCKHPKNVYDVLNENVNQLLRRIDNIRHFSTNTSEVGGNTNPDFIDSDNRDVTVINL